MANIGRLVIEIAADATDFRKGISVASLGVAALKTGAIAATGVLTGIGIGPALALSKIGTAAKYAATGLGALGSVGGGLSAGFAVKMAADFEQLTVAFSTMLRSGEQAKRLLSDISRFAAETPLEFDELAQAARNLVAFGVAQDQVIPSLRVLGNIASGVGAPLNEIAEIYGKARVQGRLFAQDINQFQGRGIPVVQALSKELGVSTSRIKEMVEEGKIGFPELQRAFAAMTAEGGQFAGMMAAQSKTLSGMFSTFRDNLSLSLRSVGETLVDLFALKAVMRELVLVSEEFHSAISGVGKTLQVLNHALGGAIFKEAAIKGIHETGKQLMLGPVLQMKRLADFATLATEKLTGFKFSIGEAFGEFVPETADQSVANQAEALKQLNEQTARFRELQQTAAQSIQLTLTPLERYRTETKKLLEAHALGLMSFEQLGRGLSRLREAFEKETDSMGRFRAQALKQFEELEASAKRVFESTRTPIEQYEKKLSDLTTLLAVGALDFETFSRAVKQANDELTKSQLTGRELGGELEDIAAMRAEIAAQFEQQQNDMLNQLPANQRPSALQAGTVEAYRASQMGRLDQPINRVAKFAEQQVQETKAATRAINDNNRSLRSIDDKLTAVEIV